MSLKQFKSLFRYDGSKQGFVGVEREAFICSSGVIVPRAQEVLASVGQNNEFAYELSKCQIESRAGPCLLSGLGKSLHVTEQRLARVLAGLELSLRHCEVGPEDMPLDIYPDPTGRYQQITKDMPREILLAACRVIGTHVHVGMRDHEMALRVYNYAIRHVQELCEKGNGSFGERLAIYRQMAPDFEPKAYRSWQDYYDQACSKGFAEDPRKCWTLIRISVHGTIEFRMFGATGSIDRIVGWAGRCHELCQEAMVSA
jgi:gamma-glutamyl:cysteine ligase YbdK (ATP-grasp superfamily)